MRQERVTPLNRSVLFAAALIGLLPNPVASAGQHAGTWVSQPRAALKITVGVQGGVITGPGWEHHFDPAAKSLDFEIGPGQRFVLHREGGAWVGQYFHPAVRPETDASETHLMSFVITGASSNATELERAPLVRPLTSR